MSYRTAIISILVIASLTAAASAAGPDISKQMKRSILFLNVSTAPYNQTQPWKYSDIGQKIGAAVAVGEYLVITPAKNVINAQFIKARRSGQNEFIPAKIKLLNYQANLCLLVLPKRVGQPSQSEPGWVARSSLAPLTRAAAPLGVMDIQATVVRAGGAGPTTLSLDRNPFGD